MSYKNLIDQLPVHPTKKSALRKLSDIKLVVLHCTDFDGQDPFAYARYDITGPNHLSRTGAPECTYHDMIDKDGNIFHTADYSHVTYHAGDWNKRSVAVSLMYKPTTSAGIDDGSIGPTQVALSAAAGHIASLCMKWSLNPYTSVRGHRELEGTGWIWKLNSKIFLKSCPGQAVQLDNFRNLVTRCIQTELLAAGLLMSKVDGIFGPKTEQALRLFREGFHRV